MTITAANIRSARQATGLTRRALAEQVGVSEATLKSWESGGHVDAQRLAELERAVDGTNRRG